MKLCVVILNYDSADVLSDCLESLPGAFSRDMECVVVDNASPGGPPTLPSIELPVRLLVNEKNLGFGGGFQSGVETCGGDCDCVALLNPDLVLEQDCLDRLVDFLEDDGRRGLVGPRIRLPTGEEQSFARWMPRPPSVTAPIGTVRSGLSTDVRAPVRCEMVHGSVLVFRREALQAIGGVPQDTFMYGEELLIAARLARAGFETWFHPGASVTHLDDVSADRTFEPLDKAIRKRTGHIEARRVVWSGPQWATWTLFHGLNDVRLAASSWLGGNRSAARTHYRLAALHGRTLIDAATRIGSAPE